MKSPSRVALTLLSFENLAALGLEPKELGMSKHVVKPTSVIDWSSSVVAATA